MRFYDPAAGRILYDDFDIGRATLESVRQQAMLVTADGPLFPAALSENIVCGKAGYTASQIGEAVKQAQADEFVLTLTDGLSTIVGGEDSPLQVDQAFRIGLARALLRDPSVIIVQEPDGRLEEALRSPVGTGPAAGGRRSHAGRAAGSPEHAPRRRLTSTCSTRGSSTPRGPMRICCRPRNSIAT